MHRPHILLLLLILATAPAFSVPISGPLSGTLGPGVYEATGDIGVQLGDTLRVLPGTTVRFAEGISLTAAGRVTIAGTEQDSVIFTGLDSAAWGGVELSHADSLSYLLVEGAAAEVALEVTGYSHPTQLRHIIVRHAAQDGLHLNIDWNSSVRHVTVDGAGGVGLDLSADAEVDGPVTVLNTIGDGIVLHGSALLHGVTVRGCGGDGMDITYAYQGVALSDVLIESCVGKGINTGAFLGIEGLTIRDCAGGGSVGGEWQEITDFLIENCGGEDALRSPSLHLTSGVVRDNAGVGVHATGREDYPSASTLTDVDVQRNGGGGLRASSWAAGFNLDRCWITHNSAPGRGGGILAEGGAPVTMSHCVVAFNEARLDPEHPDDPTCGGAVFATQEWEWRPGTVLLDARNTLFFQNTADMGGAVYLPGPLDDEYGAFAYNAVYGPGTQLAALPRDVGILDTVNANGDPCDRRFNIFLHPRFDPVAPDTLSLRPESPLIGAASPDSEDPDQIIGDFQPWWLGVNGPGGAGFGAETSPREFALLSAWPNPFNDRVTLRMDLPGRGDVRVTVTDMLGRRVGVLHDGPLPAGEHRFAWTAGPRASGTYLLVAETASGQRKARRVTLLK